MKFTSGLRRYASKRVEEIESADILAGIPCYNNQETIQHVIQMVTHGLDRHYPNLRSVIMIADGGSTDDTREVAKEFEIKPWQEKIVSIYRGPGGKGSAFRSIFETAHRLNVKACMVVDSDLRSISSDWVSHLLEPVLGYGYEYVSPVYSRYKYDGTITNNIVYNLTRSLYGLRLRQPIGGDFAFSGKLAAHYIEQDVWETDVARFGIDIWMTTHAITSGMKLCQSNLGVKIHDAKDPAEALGPHVPPGRAHPVPSHGTVRIQVEAGSREPQPPRVRARHIQGTGACECGFRAADQGIQSGIPPVQGALP